MATWPMTINQPTPSGGLYTVLRTSPVENRLLGLQSTRDNAGQIISPAATVESPKAPDFRNIFHSGRAAQTIRADKKKLSDLPL